MRFDPMRVLAGILRRRRLASRAARARLRFDMRDCAVYAVGDVHGCLSELVALEGKIIGDARSLPPCRKLIIMLGDYVDRGPASAQVLEHLLAPPPAGFERICLAGNHEVMMLDLLEGRLELSDWLHWGGAMTLHSYGVNLEQLNGTQKYRRGVDNAVKRCVPAAHLSFLRSLPVLVETPKYLFVHAGIRPGVALARQTDEDLVSIRSVFYEHAHLLDRYVVHGHTPVARPTLEGLRLNVDTGAFFSGRLTAVRLWGNKARLISC